jgi:parallel beta-helix repeat protein
VLDIDHGQYRLNGDLVCPFVPWAGAAVVTITGEGVHFNLKGYTITRDNSSGRRLFSGITVTGANAHIHNGSIVDINCPLRGSPDCSAIFLRANARGAKINGMSLYNNTQGILAIDQASGARIHGNDISGNLRMGIVLVDAAGGAMITDNDLSDTGGFTNPDGTEGGGWGYFGSADGVRLIGNVANNCAYQGIYLGSDVVGNPPGFAERNTIRDNETLDNGRAGILLWSETEAT